MHRKSFLRIVSLFVVIGRIGHGSPASMEADSVSVSIPVTNGDKAAFPNFEPQTNSDEYKLSMVQLPEDRASHFSRTDNIGHRPGKELWVTTPVLTTPAPGAPASGISATFRLPQPPGGVHVPGPKDRPDPIRDDDDNPRFLSIYQGEKTEQEKMKEKGRGIISIANPFHDSPLDNGLSSVYEFAENPYKPNTNLFDKDRIKPPYPTNKWWQNLLIEDGLQPIHPYPYAVSCQRNSSIISFPKFQASETAMTSSSPPDWTLFNSEAAFFKRAVTDYDDLGVEVEWTSARGGYMRTRMYKGMPFLTYEVGNIIPNLQTIHAIIDIKPLGKVPTADFKIVDWENVTEVAEKIANSPGLTKVTLNDNSQWLFTSFPPLEWKKVPGTNTMRPKKKYTGYIQIAHLGDKPESNLNILKDHIGIFPTEGTVQYSLIQDNKNSRRVADISMMYKINSNAGANATEMISPSKVSTSFQLLTFALPHHIDALDSTHTVSLPLSGYRCAKGPLTAIVGNLIIYEQKLQPIDFDGYELISKREKGQILQQLKIDKSREITVNATDPYFFGKGVARVARLCEIAYELDDLITAEALADTVVDLLTPWVSTSDNEDRLYYDKTWGGVVSKKGLEYAGPNEMFDFGQGRYNDHHFHYGYFAYAGAVIARRNVMKFEPVKEGIAQLLRDYANPSKSDANFPFMRHFDPYDGHSWAAGLYQFADGRNQESTGEAINAYYGAYLYAKAMGYPDLANFYEIILNMEATSGKRYWHPTREQAKSLYLKPFEHNTVGIVWSGKVDYATFFGTDPKFIYGIQMLPFTPATRLLLDPDWVKEAWCPDGSTCKGGMSEAVKGTNKDGWSQFLYTAYSLVNKDVAADNAAKCTTDDGNTLTNTLYWIASFGKKSLAKTTIQY